MIANQINKLKTIRATSSTPQPNRKNFLAGIPSEQTSAGVGLPHAAFNDHAYFTIVA